MAYNYERDYGFCSQAVLAAVQDYFGKRDSDNWKGSSKLANKVREKFIEEFGSVICNDVQAHKMGRSFDLWDSEDYKKFEEAGAHEDQCPDVTGKVARWTAEVLLEEGIKPKN